jgi:hypothetical protein
MMTLTGQHGQPQDIHKGLAMIRQAAAASDDNSPQGLYVRGNLPITILSKLTSDEYRLLECFKRANWTKSRFLS